MKTHLRLLLFMLLFVMPLHVHAQDEHYSELEEARRIAFLTVYVDPFGLSRITLFVSPKVGNREELERSLIKSFSFPLHLTDLPSRPSEDRPASNEYTLIYAENARPFTGMKIAGVIDPEPLIAPLQSQGIERLDVRVAFISETYDVVLESGAGQPSLNHYLLDIDLHDPVYHAIAFRGGYTAGELLIKTVPLIIFLLVPMLLTLGMSMSWRKFYDQPRELWGRHVRFLSRLQYALWPVWICVIAFSDLANVLRFAVRRSAIAGVLDILFYFAVPLVAMYLCHLASRGVYRRITGVLWSPSEVMRRGMLVSVVSLGPFVVLILILNTLSSDPRKAALYAAIGYFGWLFLRQAFARSFGPKLHALTSGDLRDRIFELAHKAGISLKQIYVLPEERAQLSNAFARSDDSVMITTSLLKNLSRREVDGVMAHEIGHLQAKHPRQSLTAMIVAIVVIQIVGTMFAIMLRVSNTMPVVIALSIVCASLVLVFVSRRNERQADAIGISLTEDPEAFISGLAKLSRLNLMPLHSGGWGDSFETHPNTMRRLQSVASAFGIPDERFQSLISDSFAFNDRTYPAIDEDEAESVMFSSEFKTKHSLRRGLLSLSTIVLAPLPFALALGHERVSGFWWLAVGAVGFIVSFGVYQVARNAFALSGHRPLSRALRTKLEKRGLTEIMRQGTLVGLAPAPDSRKYENYSFWDIGLLWLTREKLYYLGEQTEFSLCRAQVQEVYVEDSCPEWLPDKNLFLCWQDGPEAMKQTLHFVALGESSVLKGRRAIELLHQRLNSWRGQPDELALAPPELMKIGGPVFPEITSIPALKTFNTGPFVRVAFKFACYGAVIAFAVGLSWLSIGYTGVAIFFGTLLDELPKARKEVFSRKDAKAQS